MDKNTKLITEIINNFVSDVKSIDKDARIIERDECGWCKESMLVVPAENSNEMINGSVEHMTCPQEDYDDIVFCQRDCAVLFFERINKRSSSAEATADRQDAEAFVNLRED